MSHAAKHRKMTQRLYTSDIYTQQKNTTTTCTISIS